jgi:hypothetical protein
MRFFLIIYNGKQYPIGFDEKNFYMNKEDFVCIKSFDSFDPDGLKFVASNSEYEFNYKLSTSFFIQIINKLRKFISEGKERVQL